MSLLPTLGDVQPNHLTEKSKKSDWAALKKTAFVCELDMFKFILEFKNEIDNTDNYVLTPLMQASYRGQIDQIKILLDQGSDCNALTSNGLNAIMMATFNNHYYVVDLLIRRKTNYNFINSDGISALMLASAMGHAKTVEVLLGYEVDVNVKCKSGLTALMLAALGGFEDVVDLLIKHNADCNMVNDINKSCLIIAAENRNVRIVKSLLDNQADYTIVDENGYNALIYAAQNGFSDIVQALISKGASINTTNNKGENAFVLAVKAGHAEVVELLIKQGADYDGGIPMPSFSHSRNLELQELAFGRILDLVADAVYREPMSVVKILKQVEELKHFLKNAETDATFDKDTSIKIPALILATQLDFTEVVKVLLLPKIDVNVKDEDGNTSLMIACFYGNSEIAKLLITALSNVNLKNEMDFTALHMAVENGMTEIVEMLIEKKCDLEAKAKHGVNALLLACFFGHDNIVELLLRNDVNCNCVLNNGVSPLMLASNRGFSNIVTQLLEKGAKIDLFEIKQRLTALTLASIDGHTEIVEKICQSKKFKESIMNFQDSNGYTALMDASYNGRVDTVAFLLSMSADCNVSSKSEGTALHLAAGKGSHEITKMLLEHNCPVNKCDNYGNTALMIASQLGRVEVVREILKYKPEINTVNTEDHTALGLATAHNHLDVVKLLVQNGAEVDKINKHRYSALSIAVMKSHLEIAKYLIKNRAKCELSLLFAIEKESSEIVEMLLNSDKIQNYSRNNSLFSYLLLVAAKKDTFIILQAILKRSVAKRPNEKYLKKGSRNSKAKANRLAFLIPPADILPIDKTPMYNAVSPSQSDQPKHIEIMSLNFEKNKVSLMIDIISCKCNLLFNENQMSTLFYLADNMHFVVLEQSFYHNLLEKRNFCFWIYLYFAIESEYSFETIRTRIIKYDEKLPHCSTSTINPKILSYEKIKGSLICLRSLKSAKTDTKSNSPSPEEIQNYISTVMDEYAAMKTFEPFQFYVHQKCLHVIATFLTADSAANIVDSTLKSYTELTVLHLQEHKLLDIFAENSSLPIIHNTLQAILQLVVLSKDAAMSFAENGLVTLLLKQYRTNTRSTKNRPTNFEFKVTEHFIQLILEILRNTSHYDENKQYFIKCQSLEILRKRFPTSNFKKEIIMIISLISNQASDLPDLSDSDITTLLSTSENTLTVDNLAADWLRSLRLVAEKYESSKPMFVGLFSIFTETFLEGTLGLQELVISLLKVISTNDEASQAIAQDQDLLKGVNLFLSSNTQTGSDARVINWNTCRASGNAASIPGTPDVYSQDFPQNFEIKDQLDRGSFGTVYLVTDLEKPDEKRFVAKKIWIKEAKQDAIGNFLSEAELLLKARHKNIIQFHGYQIKDMSIIIFLEYMPKGTLATYIKKKNGLDEKTTRKFTKQILEGLEYLHQNKILHLDIKGTNILIENKNSIKIADFGLSKFIAKEHDLQAINGCGTPGYTAPEVLAGDLKLEFYSKADIWSVGCTVVQMLTQKRPDNSLRNEQHVYKLATLQKPSYKLPPNSSEELKEFLDKTFIMDPQERPSAKQLLQSDRFLLGPASISD
ncbi:uncharacterized protein LOC131935253 [Physella acuta]|uniref:uncharacterized protein LOC131935253 n=1 Tax=Physella acuta TaxID=109671 RepID=UPI0027DACC77|nr:uncharacterized protein LOC131935253 [Physella acuta]XP_059147598.1 uncharacterized protein LOC131935253 [Physella acuta]XP_059147599.1 uncharacterized protein LOC131935253 [Physella acuta]XP_059147600.1 uncharacterized protein LOC131935253 [Physella acuta]XP_059147601.1 uncharacterized protein LOC131935253 [Physella acuta]XP_059147603.1 uncharacterized protein LOC131935253 [Physella acuta]